MRNGCGALPQPSHAPIMPSMNNIAAPMPRPSARLPPSTPPPLATTEAPPAKQRISKKVQTAMDAPIAGDVGAARLHCHREGREPSESRGRADQGTQTADPPHRGRRAPTRRPSWQPLAFRMSPVVLVFGRRQRRDARQTELAGVQKAPRHDVAGRMRELCRGRYGEFAAGSGLLRLD
jgi:hypothetical protein